MSKHMQIGDPARDGATWPLRMLELRTVTLGSSGAGKTTGGRVMFEEAVAAGVVVGAIDLKGDWWGLKSSADGKSPGLKVIIFGGDHQDVPLDERGGAALAEIVADLRQPFVVDLEQLSRAKQDLFLAAFFERLYDVNREPLVLFCDEVDRYAPQKPMTPEAIKSLAATEDLAKRGRKHGIFPKFITQRNASLNKNVAELCDVAFVYRTSGPNDRKAVEAWFEAKATDEELRATMKVLSGIDTGTAIVCSAHPALRIFETVAFREPWTFDSSATPEIGKTVRKPKEMAAVDLEAVRARMSETIERMKANDPRELQKRVRELDAEVKRLKARPNEIPQDVLAAAIEQEVSRRTLEYSNTFHTISRKVAVLLDAARECHTAGGRMVDSVAGVEEFIEKVKLTTPAPAKPFVVRHDSAPAPNPAVYMLNEQHETHISKSEDRRQRAAQRFQTAQDSALAHVEPGDGAFAPNGAQQRVLNALAWYRTVGVDLPGVEQVGFIAQIKASGGHFRNTIGPLSSHGLITHANGHMALTELGARYAVAPERSPTLSEYHASIRKMLRTGAQQRVFDAILSLRGLGREIDVNAIGGYAAIDPEGGHFRNSIGPLVTLGIITRSRSRVIPTDVLFPPELL